VRPSRPSGVVGVNVDGRPAAALAGQTVAAVLVRAGRWGFSRNLVTGELRGPLCGMGVCFECLVTVDGEAGVRACLARVAEGTTIVTAGAEGG
jgi:predicted molibdopterin-dependent oxidoreductase YjgC